jgi:hypothetical protein
MPTNPTLPTLAQAIEEVKKQDWFHVLQYIQGDPKRLRCTQCGLAYPDIGHSWCQVKIARAQQAAVVKALRWAAQISPQKYEHYYIEAADAIERELEDGTK